MSAYSTTLSELKIPLMHQTVRTIVSTVGRIRCATRAV